MDIVHHGVIGGTGFIAASSMGQEVAGMAFMFGSVLPDIDVAFIAMGRRAYLKNHQGLTHSLIMTPLIALIITLPFALGFGFELMVYFAALAGLLAHVILDYLNTYGIKLLWPLRKKRFSRGIVFFIDAPAWVLTGSFFLALLYFEPGISYVIYVGAVALYILFKYALHRSVIRKLNCTHAVPSSLNPFTFFVLRETGTGVEVYRYNALSGTISDRKSYDDPDDKYPAMAKQSRVYMDMAGITKYFFITDVAHKDGRTQIIARDLAVRNFGGRFGRTTLTFDSAGRLIDELADI